MDTTELIHAAITYSMATVPCWERKHRKILLPCNLIPPLQAEIPQTAPLGMGIKKRQSTVYIWDDFISVIQRVNVDWDKTFILQGSGIFSAFLVPYPFRVLSREKQWFPSWILSFSCPDFEQTPAFTPWPALLRNWRASPTLFFFFLIFPKM